MNEAKDPLLPRERAGESVAAITYFLGKESDPYRRDLLMRDYALRSRGLASRPLKEFHQRVVDSFLPDQYSIGYPSLARASERDVTDVDVVMLAVQPIELTAAIAALGISRVPDRRYKERNFFHATIPFHAAGRIARPGELSVALTAVGQSLNLHTVQAVGEISEVYRAQIWILVGMAAGLEGKIRKGDVCLPETVWWYEPGRERPDMFEPRPEFAFRGMLNRQLVRFDPVSESLSERLRRAVADVPDVYRPDDLEPDFMPKVTVLKDAVATGEKLLRDPNRLASLHQSNERIILGDQESYGFALACRDVNWMIARGVADYGDERKDDGWQYLATILAAHCVLEFLEQDYIPPGTDVGA
jgi:nucleoside phosphorylase